MAIEKFANTAATTLNGAINNSVTSLVVTSASAFPASGNFRILIDSEIMLVTGVSGTTFTVTRGVESTSAASHSDAVAVTHVLTAASLLNSPGAMTTSGDIGYLDSNGAAARLAIGSAGKVLTSISDLPAWDYTPNINFLINGGFDFFQRQTPGTLTSRADANYGPDRWYLIGESTATDIQSARTDETTNGLTGKNSCKLANNNVADKYTGLAQIVESQYSIPLRGCPVRLQARVKTSTSSRPIRCAILEFTGTADSVDFAGTVARDPILTWTSTTYTAGNFFRSSSLTVVGVSSSTTPGTSYGDIYVTGTISTSCSNVVVVFWEEGRTATGGATWNIMQAGLYVGTAYRDWTPRPWAHELLLCQRHFVKTYVPDVPPGTGSNPVGYILAVASGTATTSVAAFWKFPVPMFAAPTNSLYNWADGTANEWRNSSDSASIAASVSTGSLMGPAIRANATPTDQIQYRIHATAEAEL